MEYQLNRDGTTLTVKVWGKLDTVTAPTLDKQLQQEYEGTTRLIFDFEGLRFISSAGLRVVLRARHIMQKQGELILRNVCPEVMEVFQVTGFADDLTFV